MSFDGGVAQTKFVLGQVLEMSALNCSVHLMQHEDDRWFAKQHDEVLLEVGNYTHTEG